jgi:hypothetical protein
MIVIQMAVLILVCALALGGAYALAAGCLRLVVGAITRDQYNVTSASAPR